MKNGLEKVEFLFFWFGCEYLQKEIQSMWCILCFYLFDDVVAQLCQYVPFAMERFFQYQIDEELCYKRYQLLTHLHKDEETDMYESMFGFTSLIPELGYKLRNTCQLPVNWDKKRIPIRSITFTSCTCSEDTTIQCNESDFEMNLDRWRHHNGDLSE